MDASCTIQEDIHVFSLIYKYVSRILGTYHLKAAFSEHMIIFGQDKDYNLKLQLNTKQRRDMF